MVNVFYSLYKSMVLCAYTSLVQQRILCDIDTLTDIIENNTRPIFPFWITIKPHLCKGNDFMFLRPTELKEICVKYIPRIIFVNVAVLICCVREQEVRK